MADKKTEKEEKNTEREYVIPLRREWRKVSRYKRANKAVKAVKEFLARHMKIRDRDLNKIKVDKFLNESIWSRGIKNPPTKIKVKAVKEPENDIVRVELAELTKNMKFRKSRDEKRNQKALEIVQSKKSAMDKIKEAASGAGRKSESSSEASESSGKETKEETEKEKEEKKAATVEAEKMIEKEISKSQKHTTPQKTEKQSKGQRTGYNATSRGK